MIPLVWCRQLICRMNMWLHNMKSMIIFFDFKDQVWWYSCQSNNSIHWCTITTIYLKLLGTANGKVTIEHIEHCTLVILHTIYIINLFNKIWTDGFVVFVLGCHSKSQQQQPSIIILCKHVMFQLFYSVFPFIKRDSNWHKPMLIHCCDCKLFTVHHVIGCAEHVNFTFSSSAGQKTLIFTHCTLCD